MGLRKIRGVRGALAIVVPAIVLTGLAACGGSSNSSDTASGAQSSTSTPAATTATTTAPVVTTAAAPVLKSANSDKFGPIAVDASGKSLYTFDKDNGQTTSQCTGTCAQTWPALVLPAGGSTPVPATGITGTLALSARSDGGSQVTLNGKPLYRYAGDANPGDTNGDGVGGIWHIAKLS